MSTIRQVLRIIRYGLFLEYHLNKRNIINPELSTVFKYHYEMANHYYEKIYGKKYG